MRYFLKFLKNTIFFIFKQVFATIITLVFLVVLIGAIAIAFVEESRTPVSSIEDNTYLELSFPSGLEEGVGVDWKYLKDQSSLNFYNVIEALEKSRVDERIDGVIINLDTYGLNSAQTEELGKKLIEVKSSGKKIYAYGNYLQKSNYTIALSADEIYMTPSHSTYISLGGYELKVPYYKELADRFGVEFQVVNVGDFKSYGENYVKPEMSNEFKEDYVRLLDRSLDNFIYRVSYSRKIGQDIIEKKLLDGSYLMLDSKSAKVEGLIDGLAFYDDFLEMKEIENVSSIGEYYADLDIDEEEAKIGLIVAEGSITMQSTDNYRNKYISPESIIPQIERAMEDDDIKGVVLRVDSPGGSALASEIILDRLIKLNEVKPVYVSMGSTAASGGYYISSNAKKIFADKKTVTGSIGVVSLFFNLEEFYEKLGLKWESIERGKNLSLLTLSEASSEEELELIRNSSRRTYEEFKARVIQGRGIEEEELEKIAQGKVWLGSEAVENGLVDEIGTLENTIDALARDLELINFQVVNMQRPKSEFDMLFEMGSFVKGEDNLLDRVGEVEERLKYYQELNGKFNYIMPYEIELD